MVVIVTYSGHISVTVACVPLTNRCDTLQVTHTGAFTFRYNFAGVSIRRREDTSPATINGVTILTINQIKHVHMGLNINIVLVDVPFLYDISNSCILKEILFTDRVYNKVNWS